MVYNGVISGLTVKLRSVNVSDAEVTYRMRMDQEKVRFMHKINGTVDDQRRYIENQRQKEGDYLFVVLDNKDKIIGMRGIYNVTQDSAESGRTIGYGNAFENMEAIILGIDFAFETLNVNAVYMDAAKDNHSVRGIQEQLGTQVLKEEYIEELDNIYVFSVLYRESYQQHRESIMKLVERYAKRFQKQ